MCGFDIENIKELEKKLSGLCHSVEELYQKEVEISKKILDIRCRLLLLHSDAIIKKNGCNISSLDDTHESELTLKIDNPNISAEKDDIGLHNDETSQVSPISVRYCSVVSGSGFDNADLSEIKGIRSLYVIELLTDNTARYYPIAESAKRLINNRIEVLDPLCDADNDIGLEDFHILQDDYGLLRLDNSNRWNVEKRCRICTKSQN